MICDICCNKCTQRNKQVVCQNKDCLVIICSRCFMVFLLTETKQKCMNCNLELHFDFILKNTNDLFIEKYFKKLGALEIEKEQHLLQPTQNVLNMELEYKQLRKTKQPETKNRLKQLKTLLEKNTTDFIFCPFPNCNGFICGNTCTLCFKTVCLVCNEENNSNHACKSDFIKNLYLIKKDTQFCPMCKILIHKIDGCDQMFCTQCKTSFSWKYKKIFQGTVPNPDDIEKNNSLEWNQTLIKIISVLNEDVKLKEISKEKNISMIEFITTLFDTIFMTLQYYKIDTSVVKKMQFRKEYLIEEKKNRKKAKKQWFNKIVRLLKQQEIKLIITGYLITLFFNIETILSETITHKNYEKMWNSIVSHVENFNLQCSKKIYKLNTKTIIIMDHGLKTQL